ncbi:MAG: hypothetical protein ACU0GG_05050 [Paracoccaceae bacterium]
MSTDTTQQPNDSKSTDESSQQGMQQTAQQAQDAAREVAEKAADEASRHAHSAKDGVADEISNVSSALRTAADELRNGSPQERTFGQIADGLASASDALRKKDLGEMAGDLSAFARRNPLAFVGGALLVGFAATRFAKASRQPPTAQPDYSTSHSAPQTPTNFGTQSSRSMNQPDRSTS